MLSKYCTSMKFMCGDVMYVVGKCRLNHQVSQILPSTHLAAVGHGRRGLHPLFGIVCHQRSFGALKPSAAQTGIGIRTVVMVLVAVNARIPAPVAPSIASTPIIVRGRAFDGALVVRPSWLICWLSANQANIIRRCVFGTNMLFVHQLNMYVQR